MARVPGASKWAGAGREAVARSTAQLNEWGAHAADSVAPRLVAAREGLSEVGGQLADSATRGLKVIESGGSSVADASRRSLAEAVEQSHRLRAAGGELVRVPPERVAELAGAVEAAALEAVHVSRRHLVGRKRGIARLRILPSRRAALIALGASVGVVAIARTVRKRAHARSAPAESDLDARRAAAQERAAS